MHALREQRVGQWRDINGNGAERGPVSRRYLTLWLDHGSQPSGATYCYVVVPHVSPARTAELSADPDLEIVANTERAQAIRVPRLGLTALNFWTHGSVDGITLTGDGPAAVRIRARPRPAGGIGPPPSRRDDLTVAIADPTHRTHSLSLTLDRPGYASWHGDDTVSVDALHPHIAFSVDTRDSFGATHTVTFRRAR